MMDCKKLLVKLTVTWIKQLTFCGKKGWQLLRKAGRIAAEGLVEAYIHGAGRIGVMVEVNCETDFVAKTDDFHGLAKDIAMQIAARTDVCSS